MLPSAADIIWGLLFFASLSFLFSLSKLHQNLKESKQLDWGVPFNIAMFTRCNKITLGINDEMSLGAEVKDGITVPAEKAGGGGGGDTQQGTKWSEFTNNWVE